MVRLDLHVEISHLTTGMFYLNRDLILIVGYVQGVIHLGWIMVFIKVDLGPRAFKCNSLLSR